MATHPSGEDQSGAVADYRRLLDRSLAPICTHDGQTILYVNPAAVRALGASADAEVVGRSISDFVDPASAAGVHARLAGLRHDGDVSEPSEVTLLRLDGTKLVVHSVAAVRMTDGRPTFEVIFGDRLPLADEAQRWTERRLRAVLDLLHDGVVIMDSSGRFEFTNAAARRILGSDAVDLVGVHHSASGVDLPMYNTDGQQISTDAHPIRWIQRTGLALGGDVVGVDRVDGQRVWITGHGCLIDPSDPHDSSVLFSFTDVTEHYDGRERLLYEATHDWLTGLPNRVHALNEAANALAENGIGRLSAVLFIDLNGLKTVNDSHGHAIGDDVLRSAAQRMRSETRAQDLVARIGGDEFVVLLKGPVTVSELEALAARLHDILAEDIVVGTLTLRIGASIGITTIGGDDERSLAEVLRDADSAMYEAKARGPANTVRFEPPGQG